MKVLIIHKTPPFNRGGAEQIIWKTAKRFATEGHEVVFFCPDSKKDRETPQEEGIDFEWVSASNTRTKSQLEFFIRGPRHYPSVYRTVDPDLVYDNICPFPFHLAHFYGDAPVVSKVHAIYRLDALACKHEWPVKIGTMLGEETYRLFSNELFVTNSESTKERLSTLVRESKNDIIANPIGIDATDFEFSPSPNSNMVLALSKLSPRKNISGLLQAWTRVEEALPDAELVIAGSGPLESELRTKATKLDLSSVEFKGFVPEEQKHELLQKAGIYVLPTLYEGFGLSNLEAMASGCAVISTNTWGVRDYLNHEQNGLVVKPKSPNQLSDAIIRLLTDCTLTQYVVDQGKKTAESFSIENNLDRELEIVSGFARGET